MSSGFESNERVCTKKEELHVLCGGNPGWGRRLAQLTARSTSRRLFAQAFEQIMAQQMWVLNCIAKVILELELPKLLLYLNVAIFQSELPNCTSTLELNIHPCRRPLSHLEADLCSRRHPLQRCRLAEASA